MKNKKINSIITGSVIAVLVVLFLIIIVVNYTRDSNTLSIKENKWITDNINNVIDINVFNNVPIYGYNGSGIAFDFINAFASKYNIKFNKISYYDLTSVDDKDVSFRVLNSSDKVSNQDILFYEDEYVVLAKENSQINSISDLHSIGILKDNSEYISDYLGVKDIFVYDNISSLMNDLISNKIKYIVIPNNMYTSQILVNDLRIVYKIGDLSKKYVLRVNDKTLYNIMKKYYNFYKKDSFLESYSNHFLNIYFNNVKVSDVDRKNYNGKIYRYGYAVNMPYEAYSNKNLVGTLSNYISDFARIINTEIEVVRYDSIDDVKRALVNGDVDFALTTFDYSNINMKNYITYPVSDVDYVVLGKNNININSLKGLRGNKVSVVLSSNLHSLCINNKLDVELFKNTDDLIRNIDEDDIILLDKNTYYFYQNEKLFDYHVLYEDKIKDGYKFIVNENDEIFSKLLNYYVSRIDYKDIRFDYNSNLIEKNNNNSMQSALLVIILIIVVVFVVIYISNKYNNNVYLKKEEKLKYIDSMTSLKNRNYLNQNIYKWDDNVIFPQSVIMLDVNQIKKINDKYGREVGDDIIKKVASILINNQLENTDIVRTGGDEFLIYMIGYEKEKVLEYIKKLSRELKKIDNSYGVSVGYSMILDEVKSVDDAINEAIIMMEEEKEKS